MQTQPIDRDYAVDDALTALYRAHALRLTRLAYVMLGDRGAAEDIVQEAFAGLHRRWSQLSDQSAAAGPYDDLQRQGLPPTPIDNPGVAAVEAVLNPASGPWLYFLGHGPGKPATFSATGILGASGS